MKTVNIFVFLEKLTMIEYDIYILWENGYGQLL